MKKLGIFSRRGRLAVGVAWIGVALTSSIAQAAYANSNTFDMAAGRSLSPLAQNPIPIHGNVDTSTDAIAIRQAYLFGGPERIFKAEIFESDKRKPISELRRRDPDTLSPEERAILQAAAQVGELMCRGASGTGTLIQLEDGRDAVVATAHGFFDKTSKESKCDLRDVVFCPNLSYYNPDEENFEGFLMNCTKTDSDLPLNFENQTVQMHSGCFGCSTEDLERVSKLSKWGRIVDFLVFILDKNVISDLMPDSTIRGFMKAEVAHQNNCDFSDCDFFSYLIGYNQYFFEGLVTSYESCPYGTTDFFIYHLCSTTDTSSSSALTIPIDGEMRLVGIHTAAKSQSSIPIPMPDFLYDGNTAIRIDRVHNYLNRKATPLVSNLTIQ